MASVSLYHKNTHSYTNFLNMTIYEMKAMNLSNLENLTKSTEQFLLNPYVTIFTFKNMDLRTKLPSKVHLCQGSMLMIPEMKL